MEGDLTRSEQRIPRAKHAMKPFTLVPQLNDDDSTTCGFETTITYIHAHLVKMKKTHNLEMILRAKRNGI